MHPMSIFKCTAGCNYFLLEVLDILFRYMASWILSNTNLMASDRNLKKGPVWISYQDNDPKQTSESTKNGSLSTK